MREAMSRAEVGDDVYGEDPTVNRLEERAAEMFGKPAALFVPTGTMGNTIAIKLHTEHGQEVICDYRCHILNYELSMMAWFAGCVARPIHTTDGILTWEQIRAEIRPLGPHAAPTGLIEIENTHNMAGEPCTRSRSCRGFSRARIGWASGPHGRSSGVPCCDVSRRSGGGDRSVCRYVMFCLSKGLGAPAGSMLVGSPKR